MAAPWWMLLTSAHLPRTHIAGSWGDSGRCRKETRSTESRGMKRWQWPGCSPWWLAAIISYSPWALATLDATHQVSLGGHGHEDDIVPHPDLLSLGPLLGGGVHCPPASLAWSREFKRGHSEKYSDARMMMMHIFLLFCLQRCLGKQCGQTGDFRTGGGVRNQWKSYSEQ